MISTALEESDILIVDDQPDNLNTLKLILAKEKYQVREAFSGKLALNSVAEKIPDLIILDIRMPIMDGYEVCRQLKAHPETKDIPVIFISGLSEVEDKVKAFQAGGIDYITKPFQGKEVILRVKTHLKVYKYEKELEKRARVSEERYRDIFQKSLVGICIISPTEQFEDCNEAFAEMLGYTVPEMLQMKISDVTPPEDYKLEISMIQELIEGKRDVLEFQKRYITKNGNIVWAELLSNVKRDESGHHLYAVSMALNITERMQAEESTKKSSIIIDSTSDAIITADITGMITFWNKGAEKIYGYTKEEALGKSIEILYSKDQLSVLNSVITKILQGKDFVTIEATCIDKNKNNLEILLSLTSIQDEKGSIIELVSVIKDITEQKATQLALKDSEEKFRTVFDQQFLFTGILSPEGRLLEINQLPLRVLGYKREDYVGKYFWQAPVWGGTLEWQEKIKSQVFQAIEIDTPLLTEDAFQTKEGEIRYSDSVYTAIRNSDNQLQYILIQAYDITGRKRHQQILAARLIFNEFSNLHSVDELLQKVLDEAESLTGSNIGFFHFLSPDQKTLSLQMWSSNTLAKMCKSEGKDLHYPLNEAGVWADAIREKKPVVHNDFNSLDHRKGFPEGHASVIRELVVPIFRENKIVAVIGMGNKESNYTENDIKILEELADMAWDIVFRKRAEEEQIKLKAELQQTQKMEAIGTLAGGIAHDFNNILFTLTGYAELIKKKLPADSDLKEHLNQILIGGNRAKDLVQQILTFSRQNDVRKKPIEITPIIKESIKFMRSSLPTTIDIIQEFKSNSASIMADPTQVHQVVVNLCTNAGHAMEKTGGVLEIVLEEVEVEDTFADLHNLTQSTYLKLSVRDTGHGMSAEIKELIFHPFFTTKDQGEGTGMGLSVVHGIIKNYQGAIVVSSEEGVGTLFEVYFPKIESAEIQPVEEMTPAPGGEEHILLVEDEDILIDMVQEMLEDLGYRVTAIMNSTKALEAFSANPELFDLVITDQTMPSMTGAELGEKIKLLRPNTPLILMTGYSKHIFEEQARKIGFSHYLMKPFDSDDLGKAIREALEARIN